MHRDIKPSNLLVDDHGKLWVTDFGLARCREHAGLTQTGDVLGTMRYMSPEQALGPRRTRRSSHRHLLARRHAVRTGHAAPSGRRRDRRAAAGRPRPLLAKPLRHWNRHIPVDFQTIIMKAIAEFPHERYPTAQELADDLDRFLEGKPILASPPKCLVAAGKWARRHRGATWAAAVVLAVVFLGQLVNSFFLWQEKAKSEQACFVAEENLHQAHAVLEKFSTSFAEQLAAIPGAEGVRAQMLETSLQFYEQMEAQTACDPALAADQALAYNQMGTLSEKLGNTQEALARQEAARKIWQDHLADEPASAEYARNLALTENNIGLLLSAAGRGTEAIESFERARRLQKKLFAAADKSPTLVTDLATTCNNFGLALRQADRRNEAIDQFRAAIATRGAACRRRIREE